jgi:23S rRNA (pseudouridine1915-N3)-methyltransferase
VRIVLVIVGRVRAPFADDVAHYERLLKRHLRLETLEVRETKGDQARIGELLQEEAGKVLRHIPASAFACVLDREATPTSSVDLAAFLEERRRSGRDLFFVIGGAFGLASSVLDRADARLSFGSLTLPHQLARVVLLEQLFRAHKILAGESYHY